jgi:hypothetical protein
LKLLKLLMTTTLLLIRKLRELMTLAFRKLGTVAETSEARATAPERAPPTDRPARAPPVTPPARPPLRLVAAEELEIVPRERDLAESEGLTEALKGLATLPLATLRPLWGARLRRALRTCWLKYGVLAVMPTPRPRA